MDAIKLIKQQHQELRELFEKFESSGRGARKSQGTLFVRIADRIAAHASMEEQLLYPRLYEESSDERLREAVEEHLVVKRLLADLLDMEPSDEQFRAKMKVLQESFFRHVKEEERSLLPEAKKLFPREELAAMGEKMEQLFSELLQSEPRRELPNETREAASLT
ncbi:MAG TPA: hemerythrin domain-containing protein [Myxococcaceae bacterium]|nr:hemerythrin domain-containing protein [Myxococcaceae bacterium]